MNNFITLTLILIISNSITKCFIDKNTKYSISDWTIEISVLLASMISLVLMVIRNIK